jgi:FKBP-type peptidyl-prolyl cis-trans isomerase
MKKLYEDIVKVMIGEAKTEMPKDIVRRAHPEEKEDEHKDKYSNDEKRLTDLRNKMQSEPWHDNHKEILTNIFAKKFPDTKVHFKKTKDNALYVTTHKPSLKNTEVDLTSNDKDTSHHFQALISGPNIDRHKDGTLVTGTSFDSVRTGKY